MIVSIKDNENFSFTDNLDSPPDFSYFEQTRIESSPTTDTARNS